MMSILGRDSDLSENAGKLSDKIFGTPVKRQNYGQVQTGNSRNVENLEIYKISQIRPQTSCTSRPVGPLASGTPR